MNEGAVGIVSLQVELRASEVCVTMETRGLRRHALELRIREDRLLALRCDELQFSVPLPAAVDQGGAIATLRNDVLDIRCPLKEVLARA